MKCGGRLVLHVLIKRNEIIVEDETGYVQTIKLNKKQHQKRLAQLGTHTRMQGRSLMVFIF